MNLTTAKNIVLQKEKERLMEYEKIFYLDPCNENDCAQCGKTKENHIQVYGKPFWCARTIKKSHEMLMDEAAELYADNKNS